MNIDAIYYLRRDVPDFFFKSSYVRHCIFWLVWTSSWFPLTMQFLYQRSKLFGRVQSVHTDRINQLVPYHRYVCLQYCVLDQPQFTFTLTRWKMTRVESQVKILDLPWQVTSKVLLRLWSKRKFLKQYIVVAELGSILVLCAHLYSSERQRQENLIPWHLPATKFQKIGRK